MIPSLNASPTSPSAVADSALSDAYESLRGLAEARIRRLPAQTLGATDLVHEAVARLLHGRLEVGQLDREHLSALAARAMRNVLVDRARARTSLKRGGGRELQAIEGLEPADPRSDHELIAVDDALAVLAREDERAARVVELRFFGGLTEVEAAAALGIDPRTARRDWRFARAWLGREVGGVQVADA